jgi:hypothetical protein
MIDKKLVYSANPDGSNREHLNSVQEIIEEYELAQKQVNRERIMMT